MQNHIFISATEAAATAATLYGVHGTAQLLASERDQTFRLTAPGADYALKICHPVEAETVIGFQLGALRHLAARAPGLPVPRVVPMAGGAALALPRYADGSRRLTCLLTFLPGTPLHATPASPAQAAALGQLMAQTALALRDCPAPAPAPKQLWDISHALEIRPKLAGAAPALKALVAPVLAAFEAETLPRLRALPAQVIHNDFNPHNLLVAADDHARITGLIDFGDLTVAPRVNDLAVALSYRVPHADARATIPDFLRGYEAVSPLTAAERGLLPGLIRARMAMTVTISAWRAQKQPENAAYLLRFHAGARAWLEAAPEILNALLREAA